MIARESAFEMLVLGMLRNARRRVKIQPHDAGPVLAHIYEGVYGHRAAKVGYWIGARIGRVLGHCAVWVVR